VAIRLQTAISRGLRGDWEAKAPGYLGQPRPVFYIRVAIETQELLAVDGVNVFK